MDGAYDPSPAFILLIVLSLIFSRTFVKSRSILVPLILHACWNLLCFAIE